MKLINPMEYEGFCCELCNNGDKNQRRKNKNIYTDFTWFGSVPTSMGTMI